MMILEIIGIILGIIVITLAIFTFIVLLRAIIQELRK